MERHKVKCQKCIQEEKIRRTISRGNERLTTKLLSTNKLHRKHFCSQYYEIKATAGLSSTSM